MANDYVDRLQYVLYNLIGCADSDGHILDVDFFNNLIEELAYIVNKMDMEIF